MRQRAELVADLARCLAPVADPLGRDGLRTLLAAAGWEPAGEGFTAGDLSAWVDDDGIRVDLPHYGLPAEADFAAIETAMKELAELLDLPPAGPLDRDEREYHPVKVRLRAGHWAVVVAVLSEGDDLPVIVEVSFFYGADLPVRLADLAGPPLGWFPVDWAEVTDRTGVEMPEDYRWVLENYGTEPLGGRVALYEPDTLGKPVYEGTRYQLLPIGVTAGGEEIAYLLDWEITGLRAGDREYDTGLLHHLVVTLAGR
ncbi:hypothetical protein [Actinoplanes utahensis]|nr:hypothetical protein [Actinoplanes utahensis]GIF29741.1 hypothetical protein Aut01nite_27270 [Actinoplanes utahensis]